MAAQGWIPLPAVPFALRATMLMAPILLASGCASGPKRSDEQLLMFPAPPAQPRVQYLTWASGAREIEESYGSFVEFVLGTDPDNLLRINQPYGIAARDGVAYVCDMNMRAICRLDFVNQTFTVLGTRGPGRLRKPVNISIDPLGYKFVADAHRREIVVFDADDQYVTAHKVPPPCFPVDVAVWQDELYVLDNDDTCQILVLDRETGELRRTIGNPGDGPAEFWKPASLDVSPEGDVYVSDLMNARIVKLSREGQPIWTKGKPGVRLGQFVRNKGLRVGDDGIIYVVDNGTAIVQMLNDKGQVLMHFGGPGNVPGSLDLPVGIAVDRSSIPYFKRYIHEDFQVEYLLFVTCHAGSHAVTVYAFGQFPEGYELDAGKIAELPKLKPGRFQTRSGPDQAETAGLVNGGARRQRSRGHKGHRARRGTPVAGVVYVHKSVL